MRQRGADGYLSADEQMQNGASSGDESDGDAAEHGPVVDFALLKGAERHAKFDDATTAYFNALLAGRTHAQPFVICRLAGAHAPVCGTARAAQWRCSDDTRAYEHACPQVRLLGDARGAVLSLCSAAMDHYVPRVCCCRAPTQALCITWHVPLQVWRRVRRLSNCAVRTC